MFAVLDYSSKVFSYQIDFHVVLKMKENNLENAGSDV